MKTMSCKQLGGACEKEFHANSFEEIAEISKQHGMEMFQKKDGAHLQAMNEIQELKRAIAHFLDSGNVLSPECKKWAANR